MGTYAYCVVPARHTPPSDLVGLQEARVEVAEFGAVGVWTSETERPQVSVEAVQQHNRVVEVAVTESVTPVPLRFGQWLPDRGALAAHMAERGAEYETQLARFGGCLEFGVRIVDPDAPEEARDVQAWGATSGREYMQALRQSGMLAEQRKAFSESVAEALRGLVHGLIREEKVEAAQTKHAVLTVSHLVAREHFDEYRERVRQLRTLYPALRLLLSGPWPPYSFAV